MLLTDNNKSRVFTVDPDNAADGLKMTYPQSVSRIHEALVLLPDRQPYYDSKSHYGVPHFRPIP